MRCRALPALLGTFLALAAPGAFAGGEDEPSLSAVLPRFGAVRIAPRIDPAASPPTGHLVLEDGSGKPVYRFPELPGAGEYAYFRTDALALADVDADGREDVIAIVELVTGIGPSGAEPFKLAGVYRQQGDGFERATELEAVVNDPPAYGRWDDIGSLRAILKERGQPGG
jgi:hypothetical protein